MSILELADVCGDVDVERLSVDRQNVVGTGIQTVLLPRLRSPA